MNRQQLLWTVGLLALSLLVLGLAWTVFRWTIRLAVLAALVFVILLWWKDRDRE